MQTKYKTRYRSVPTVRWMRMKVRGMSSAAGTAATASSPGVTLGTAIRLPVTVKSRMV